MPDNWVPSEKVYRWAREKNLDDNRLQACIEAFIGHARATGRRLADWDEGLMVWIRREKDFAQQGRGTVPRAARKPLDMRCCWTAGGTKARCEASGDVHMGDGRFLCSGHAAEHSRLYEKARSAKA
jgi:hypothetical protein